MKADDDKELQLLPANISAFCNSALLRLRLIFGDPDREMAAVYNPTLLGDDSNANTEVPPLDCPDIVTELGSPPKVNCKYEWKRRVR